MPGSIVGAGSSLVGGLISSNSASQASKTQAAAAQQAIQAQQQAFGQVQNALSPYTSLGSNAASYMNDRLGTYTNNIDLPTMPDAVALPQAMTQGQLESTPGYQFNLSQGLKSVQNSAAAKGLGISGSALKGAATYATGLADSTYQNQFANQMTQYNAQVSQNAQLYGQRQQNFSDQATNIQNGYNRLLGITSLGGSAANALSSAALGVGSGVAGSLTGAGNAAAAGDLASGKAIGNALTSAGGYGAYGANSGGINRLSQYFGGSGSGTNLNNYAGDPDLSAYGNYGNYN